MNPTKEYLGDSVYAEFDSFGSLVLTTDNGLGPSNTITLEPQVIQALSNYVQRMTSKGGELWGD